MAKKIIKQEIEQRFCDICTEEVTREAIGEYDLCYDHAYQYQEIAKALKLKEGAVDEITDKILAFIEEQERYRSKLIFNFIKQFKDTNKNG